ncbi:MAG: response regulator [Planctomycetota bacterium]|jgi:two-component system response regulator VicR
MSKIMVVDDDAGVLKTVSAILKKGGYDSIVANSGRECLKILEKEKPELIFMDVMMPDMDGWETVEKIKRDESNKGIIVAILTVKSEPEAKLKSIGEVKADWHLTKPITKDGIIQTTEWLLKKRELEKSVE